MKSQTARSCFDRVHPVVALVYFGALLVIDMVAVQPVYMLVTFAGMLGYAIMLRGRSAVRMLAWQMPLVALIALANPLFSLYGSTELFRIADRPFYLESFIFGACMGLLLACIILIISNASQVLSSDKVMALFGNRMPTVGLMLSMTLRLVPKFVRRGQTIAAAQHACTAARLGRGTLPDNARSASRANLRLVSVLMGWSMEDSLETADAMRSRGWAVGNQRTTYARYRFRRFDAAVLAAVIGMAALSALTAWIACSSFAFYPTIGSLGPWYAPVPYALLVFFPLIIEARERLVWTA